jgi:hypothetical protein
MCEAKVWSPTKINPRRLSRFREKKARRLHRPGFRFSLPLVPPRAALNTCQVLARVFLKAFV